MEEVRDLEVRKNKDWLYQKYVVEKITINQIAKLCNCSNYTIRYWMKKLNVPIRATKEISEIRTKSIFPRIKLLYRNKDWLYQKYIEEKKSMSEIAEICNTYNSTIARWIKCYNILKRTWSESSKMKRPSVGKNGRQCLYCGKDLEGRQVKYCSLKCMDKAYGDKYLDKEKAKIRNLIYLYGEEIIALLEKFNYSCQNCGDNNYIVVHHKIPLKFGGINEISNYKVLCVKCHGKEHTRIRNAALSVYFERMTKPCKKILT